LDSLEEEGNDQRDNEAKTSKINSFITRSEPVSLLD